MRHQDGFLLCFSLDNKDSLLEIPKFFTQIKRAKAPIGSGEDLQNVKVPILLVATKCDLDYKEVSTEDVEKMLQKLNLQGDAADNFIVTSAKEKINVAKGFEIIAERVKQIHLEKMREFNADNQKIKKANSCKCQIM